MAKFDCRLTLLDRICEVIVKQTWKFKPKPTRCKTLIFLLSILTLEMLFHGVPTKALGGGYPKEKGHPKGKWTVKGSVARAPITKASDGATGILEVRCQGKNPEVRLLHPALSKLPIDRRDLRPGWHGVVFINIGLNLDLRKPSHIGANEAWLPCKGEPNCLTGRNKPISVKWALRGLKEGFTFYLRVRPPQEPIVDIWFSLAGSRRAIETACGQRVE